MSFDVSIIDEKTGEQVFFKEPQQLRGGTYAVGGTTEAWLNITYNYSPTIHKVLKGGIRGLDGKKVYETLPLLAKAVGQLGDDTDPDYWKQTDGNVKNALLDLITLGAWAPHGIWKVS